MSKFDPDYDFFKEEEASVRKVRKSDKAEFSTPPPENASTLAHFIQTGCMWNPCYHASHERGEQ